MGDYRNVKIWRVRYSLLSVFSFKLSVSMCKSYTPTEHVWRKFVSSSNVSFSLYVPLKYIVSNVHFDVTCSLSYLQVFYVWYFIKLFSPSLYPAWFLSSRYFGFFRFFTTISLPRPRFFGLLSHLLSRLIAYIPDSCRKEFHQLTINFINDRYET